MNFFGIGSRPTDRDRIPAHEAYENVLRNVAETAKKTWQTSVISTPALISRYDPVLGLENCHYVVLWKNMRISGVTPTISTFTGGELLRINAIKIPMGWGNRIQYNTNLRLWESKETETIFRNRDPLELTLIDTFDNKYFNLFTNLVADTMYSANFDNSSWTYNNAPPQSNNIFWNKFLHTEMDTRLSLGDIEILVYNSVGAVIYTYIFRNVCFSDIPTFMPLSHESPASHKYQFQFDYEEFLLKMYTE